MKKGRIIAESILSIIMCSSLIAGATMALFTSESTTNIAVTSGNVDVQATAVISGGSYWDASEKGVTGAVEKTFDGKAAQYNGYYVQKTVDVNNDGKVDFGGNRSAYVEDGTLTLKNITPGDSVNLNISVTNNSNVAAYYRIKFSCDSETKDDTAVTDYVLFDSLKIDIPVDYDKDNNEPIMYSKASGAGVKSYTTAWMPLEASTDTNGTSVIANATATIELPLEIGNVAQNRTCKLRYIVEAVQGNANLGDNQIELDYIDGGYGKQSNVVTNGATVVTLNKAVNNTSVENETADVTVTIPQGNAIDESVLVKVTNTTYDAVHNEYSTIEIDTKNSVYAFDVEVTGVTDSSALYNVQVNIGKDQAIGNIYHKDILLSAVENNNIIDNSYEYDSTTGIITIYTSSFSPFIIEIPKIIEVSGSAELTRAMGCSLGANVEYDKYGEASNRSIIRLTNDIDISEEGEHRVAAQLNEGKTITLDLNGHKIWQKTKNYVNALIQISGGHLIVIDSKGTGSMVQENAEGISYGAANSCIYVQTGIVDIFGGKYTANNICFSVDKGTLNIFGGTVEVVNNACIYGSSEYYSGGTVNIYNGNFIAKETGAGWVYANYEIVVNIYGGNFTSDNVAEGNYKYLLFNFSGSPNEGKIIVKGGTFDDVSCHDGFIADGYEIKENDDGTYTVVKTIVTLGE